MPAKCTLTQEQIVDAALEMTRKQGSFSARTLAQALGVSTKPVFSLYSSMESIQSDVLVEARKLYDRFLFRHQAEGKIPPYKAACMAYIHFAKEETHLFKLLFMQPRQGDNLSPLPEDAKPLLELLMQNLRFSAEKAYLFHLEMWTCVHGIGTQIATGYLDWDLELAALTVSDVYQGLKLRYKA